MIPMHQYFKIMLRANPIDEVTQSNTNTKAKLIRMKGSASFWISPHTHTHVLDLCSKMKPKSLIHLDGHGFGGGVRSSFLRLECYYGPFLCNVV